MSRLLCPEGLTNIEQPNEAEVMAAALRVTLSPHEHEWTPEEQVAMARYCLWAAQRLGIIGRLAYGEEMVRP